MQKSFYVDKITKNTIRCKMRSHVKQLTMKKIKMILGEAEPPLKITKDDLVYRFVDKVSSLMMNSKAFKALLGRLKDANQVELHKFLQQKNIEERRINQELTDLNLNHE